jgi:hypothetical protein
MRDEHPNSHGDFPDEGSRCSDSSDGHHHPCLLADRWSAHAMCSMRARVPNGREVDGMSGLYNLYRMHYSCVMSRDLCRGNEYTTCIVVHKCMRECEGSHGLGRGDDEDHDRAPEYDR